MCARQTGSLRHSGETVAFLVACDRMEALIETMALMANHSARAAIRHDESGKGKYLPLSVFDEA